MKKEKIINFSPHTITADIDNGTGGDSDDDDNDKMIAKLMM